MTATVQVGELLYEVVARFTQVTEYGVGMADVLGGKAPVPPAGARFDVAFEGSARGPKLAGTLVGVDYLHVRADGRFELHIHARVTTEDGEHLSFFADGVAVPQAGTPVAQLRESGSFITASPKYAWLNQVQVWAHGTVDPVEGQNGSDQPCQPPQTMMPIPMSTMATPDRSHSVTGTPSTRQSQSKATAT